MSDSYSYFKCKEIDPTAEWAFSLIIIGIIYSFFFFLYLYRICYFHIQKPEYSINSLMSRIIFSFSLLIKASFSILMGIGFKAKINFYVFKYLVTDLPDYIVCSAITYMLYSWSQVFLYSGMLNLTNSLSIIQSGIVGYNAFIYTVFSIFLLLRCALAESYLDTWYFYTRIFIVVINILLVGLFVMVLIIMKKQLHFTFSCNLGNPEHYLFMLCLFFIAILTTQSGFNITLCLDKYINLTECSEIRLILKLCTECIGKVLPLGFITIVDVISLPPPEAKPALSIFDD